MNALTMTLIQETARANKVAAKNNGDQFCWLMRCAHEGYLIAEIGYRLKQRALDLFRQFHPEFFDGEFIQDYHRIGFDLDVELSEIAARVMWRKVDRDPALQLVEDYGDLPERIAEPQYDIDLDVDVVEVEKPKRAIREPDAPGGDQLDLFGGQHEN